jgi:hypothetical protein
LEQEVVFREHVIPPEAFFTDPAAAERTPAPAGR